MIKEVEIGKRYLSYSGRPFVVAGFMRYALNCSVNVVRYQNLLPTDDAEALSDWCVEESVFLRTFRYDDTETYATRTE